MITKAICELFCRLAPQKVNVKFLIYMGKIKCFKLVEPYVNWYIAGSKYNREYESAMHNHARIYIAYDGCFDLGVNFQETTNRGWFLFNCLCRGVVHPYIKDQIVADHKEQFPLDFYLGKLSKVKQMIAEHIKSSWYWYVIYSQVIVMGNLA